MKKYLFYLLLPLAALSSCEDPIELEVEAQEKQLSVDAFLNNLPETQKIILKRSKGFFEGGTQQAVTGANVKVVSSDGKTYLFQDSDNDGVYTWNDSVLVHEGLNYQLSIEYDGEVYTASQTANPVPSIDSIVTGQLEPAFGPPAEPGDLQVELFAKDLPNRNDYYWFRYYRNDTLNTNPGGINAALNGGDSFDSDGVLFIPPIRFVSFNDFDRPYKAGEKIKIQIWSINRDTYLFLKQVASQINNGGLFAVPPSNVRTNIVSSSDAVEKKAIGMFSISMITEQEANF